jgi:uncharacterized membrane protein YdjX (TVP38/TMEM64 family)
VDPKQARSALVQFAVWGLMVFAVGVAIAAATWPHDSPEGTTYGDATGFWFGLLLAWLGTMLTSVPLVAWGAKLGRHAWPSERESTVAAP